MNSWSLQQMVNKLHVSVIYVTRYTFDENWVMEERYFPYSVFWLVEEGAFRLTVNGDEVECHEGDMLHLPHGSCIGGKNVLHRARVISIRFQGEIQDHGSNWSQYLHMPVKIAVHSERVRPLFESLFALYKAQTLCRNLRMQAELNLLIAESLEQAFERKLRETGVDNDHMKVVDERIRKIHHYLLANPVHFPSVKQLCRLVMVSESHIRSLFRYSVGMSPLRYLHAVKIEMAKDRLIHTDDRISDIAASLGYEDPNYFARIFKRMVRCSPQSFRKENKMTT